MTDWVTLDDQTVTFPSVIKPAYMDADYVQDMYVVGGYISYDVGDPDNVFSGIANQPVTFPYVIKPAYVADDYVSDLYVAGGYISYDVGDPANVFTKQDKAGTSWQ